MPTAAVSHDLTIEDADGTNKKGFMLWRDRRGQRRFSIRDAQVIAPRVLTQGELTQAEMPPAIALTWYQSDWQLGIGGRKHAPRSDAEAPQYLASGSKVDTSVPGVLRLARGGTATTNN